MARGDFCELSRLWTRSNLGLKKKLSIFQALIESKLLYSLSTCCFHKGQLRRLDGFQARCLRSILGIAPSFISRVSNREVLARASWQPLSETLTLQQLAILGKVLRADQTSPLYACSFSAHNLQPLVSQYVRKVGRPRKEWVPSVVEEATLRSGRSTNELAALAQNCKLWARLMRR